MSNNETQFMTFKSRLYPHHNNTFDYSYNVPSVALNIKVKLTRHGEYYQINIEVNRMVQSHIISLKPPL